MRNWQVTYILHMRAATNPWGLIDAVGRKQVTETISQVPRFSSDKLWLIPGSQVPGHRRGCKPEAGRTGLTTAWMWGGVGGTLWVSSWTSVAQSPPALACAPPLFILTSTQMCGNNPFCCVLAEETAPKGPHQTNRFRGSRYSPR